MPSTPTIDAFVRGRFVPLPGAELIPLRANAFTVRLPRTPEIARALRVAQVSVDSLDPEIILAIDGQECAQAIVSAESDGFIDVTALV